MKRPCVVVDPDGSRWIRLPLTERALALLKTDEALRAFEKILERTITTAYLDHLDRGIAEGLQGGEDGN
jgi:hypothetical protein